MRYRRCLLSSRRYARYAKDKEPYAMKTLLERQRAGQRKPVMPVTVEASCGPHDLGELMWWIRLMTLSGHDCRWRLARELEEWRLEFVREVFR